MKKTILTMMALAGACTAATAQTALVQDGYTLEAEYTVSGIGGSSRSTIGINDKFYVNDYANDAILVYDKTGALTKTIKSSDATHHNWISMNVDAAGHLLVQRDVNAWAGIGGLGNVTPDGSHGIMIIDTNTDEILQDFVQFGGGSAARFDAMAPVMKDITKEYNTRIINVLANMENAYQQSFNQNTDGVTEASFWKVAAFKANDGHVNPAASTSTGYALEYMPVGKTSSNLALYSNVSYTITRSGEGKYGNSIKNYTGNWTWDETYFYTPMHSGLTAFNFFTIGEKQYIVYPAINPTKAAADDNRPADAFAIAEVSFVSTPLTDMTMEGETLVDGLPAGKLLAIYGGSVTEGGNTAYVPSYTIEKVEGDDNSVYIYVFMNGAPARKWKFSVAAEEPALEPATYADRAFGDTNGTPYYLEYTITRNADKTLDIAGMYNFPKGNPDGLVDFYHVVIPGTFTKTEIKDGEGTTTDVKFEDGQEIEITFQKPIAGGLIEVKAPYTVGTEQEMPEMPEEPVIEPEDKAHFAYNLNAEKGAGTTYVLTFNATGDVKTAYLVLTNVETGETYEEEIDGVYAGENTYTFDSAVIDKTAAWNWAIRLHNNTIEETIVTDLGAVGGSRAGLAVFNDPEFPETFGYVVVGRTQNGGIDVYNPLGQLEQSAVHAGCAAIGNTNTSSPMDATQRGNEVYLASWGDASVGVVAYDITTPDVAPYAVFEGTKEANGKMVTADGVATGSGTPCVGIWGEGEETTIITFDEDIFANKLTMNVIGTGKTTANPAQLIGNGFNAQLANTNVGVATTKGGFFASQCRANGMEETTSGLRYFARTEGGNFDSVWKVFDQAEEDATLLPSALAGIGLSYDESKIVVPGYDAIYVYDVNWNDNVPSLSNRVTINNPYGRQQTRTNARFDAAGNIYLTQQSAGFYRITLANEEAKATTPAPKASLIESATGVDNIAVDADEAGAVYYNLNGVRVEGNMVPGVYVKVVGKTATKVVVK